MRQRLQPTTDEAEALLEHAAQARFVWNLALEQANQYRHDRGPTPGWAAQCRQLVQLRAEHNWIGTGSSSIQQQALKDLAQAFINWWKRPGHFGRPTWRKRGQHEGFRVVNVTERSVEILHRRAATVFVPKVGRVRFRITRPVPLGIKSYRIRRDAAGRWWLAFAVKPQALTRGEGEVGIDRGVARSLAFSDGTFSQTPSLSLPERRHLLRLQRKLARRVKGSVRRGRVKLAIARLRARESDRAKDWVEKQTTRIVRASRLVVIEKLQIRNMVRSVKGSIEEPGKNVRQKAGLSRVILAQRWGLFARRLREKSELAGVELIEVNPAYTSQQCYACGHTAPENRESQAKFRCQSCGRSANADTNAALNILAAGRAVNARGGTTVPLKREPTREVRRAA